MKCDTFGENLRRLRKMYGMAQEDVARVVDVNKYTISKYECNKCYPRKNIFIKLKSLFKLNNKYTFSNYPFL